MSQYVAVGVLPSVFSSPLTKITQQLAKAGVKVSTGPTGTTVTPQKGFISQYKWYLLGAVAVVGGAFYLRRRRKAAGGKRR